MGLIQMNSNSLSGKPRFAEEFTRFNYCRMNEPPVHPFEPPNADIDAAKSGEVSHMHYISKYLSV